MTCALQTFTDPAAFLSEAQPFLEAHESRNNLLLGMSIRLIDHPDWTPAPPFLALLRQDVQPRLAALMSSPGRLLLSSSPQLPLDHPSEALDRLCDRLLSGSWIVSSANAENTLARQFADRWTRATGAASRVSHHLRIYELRQVIPPPRTPPGVLRPANPEDYETIVGWHHAFQMEALGEGDLESSRKIVAQRLSSGDTFLWDDNGPVSMALRSRPTRHGCTIGGVYTPSALRVRGYASACVAALSQFLLDSGKQFCNLYTDLSNPTSNSIYQKIGYSPICDCLEYTFKAG